MDRDFVFEYFPDYRQWAKFTNAPCEGCGQYNCLEGIYFGGPSSLAAVCLDCLITGRIRVYIPSYIEAALEKSVREAYNYDDPRRAGKFIAACLDKLSKTPPVPWIQDNEWPVCEGNFCRYIGEWSLFRLTLEAPQGSGLAYLMSIITDPQTIGSPEELWRSIDSGMSVVFMFECLSSGKRIAVVQSY